jgi:hypothetical protein
MQPPPSLTPSGPPGLPPTDVLLYLLMLAVGGAIGALLRFFGVRSSQTAPLQEALNGAFSALTKELQEERAQLIVRISEQDRELAGERLKVAERDATIRGMEQSRDSLIALLKRSDIPVPGE